MMARWNLYIIGLGFQVQFVKSVVAETAEKALATYPAVANLVVIGPHRL